MPVEMQELKTGENGTGKPVELLYMRVCGLLFVTDTLLSLQKTGKNPAKSCGKTRRKMNFGRFSAAHLEKNKIFFRGFNRPQRPINKRFGGEAGLPETAREKFFLKKGLTMRGVCSSFLVPLEKPATVIRTGNRMAVTRLPRVRVKYLPHGINVAHHEIVVWKVWA